MLNPELNSVGLPPTENLLQSPETPPLPESSPDTAQPENPDSPPSASAPDPDQEAFARLAQLSTTQYDRVRRVEAKRLALRVSTSLLAFISVHQRLKPLSCGTMVAAV